MKTTSIVAVFLVLAMGVARAEVLKKLSLDDASAVTPKIETDTIVKVEGASSLRIRASGASRGSDELPNGWCS
jgi:hypothetical protein